jgi:hypothetical protein
MLEAVYTKKTMNSSTTQPIFGTLEQRQRWRSTGIFLKVSKSFESDHEEDIDLTKTILEKSIQKRQRNPKHVWFHRRWNDCSQPFRDSHISPVISKACRDAGFEVVASWDASRGFSGAINFKCARAMIARSKQPATSKTRRIETKRSRNVDELCKFAFSLFMISLFNGGTLKTLDLAVFATTTISKWIQQQSGFRRQLARWAT